MTAVRLLDHWSPPDGAGQPVACLATSFTFEADFFTQDCLARFLSLSTVAGEGDSISSIAALLEEEDRLSETQVSVLVDRSSPAEKRNLRWDVLPVAAPGGLLHAKVGVLLWERFGRIILGSANLTSAGYRRQIELVVAIDLDETCQVPRAVLDDLVDELRRLAELAPGPLAGPKGRALTTVDRLADRVDALELSHAGRLGPRLALAPARPGVTPLERLDEVWRGPQPLRATWVSPFWDDRIPAPAIETVRRRLTGRPADHRSMRLLAAIDPFTGTVQAPLSLASQKAVVVAFDPPDREPRSLHAKLLLVESDEWCAALVGSSNATESGFGLNDHRGHHELNLWIGCPADSPTAKHLRALARVGERVSLGDQEWEPPPDEDEPTAPALPLGFVSCLIEAAAPPSARLEFEPNALPTQWQVRTPADRALLTADAWRARGSPDSLAVDLPDDTLPPYLLVRWNADGESFRVTWTANVENRAALPPPAELRELPIDVLLAALASSRPLPAAVEHELRRRQRASDDGDRAELDPLRRFDDSGLLLQRARHLSLALWRLQDRLARPATNVDALHWRLHGPFGPLVIADRLVDAARDNATLPGEAHFLLAELALTIAAVDWAAVAVGLDPHRVRSLVADVLDAVEERHQQLPAAPDASLEGYLQDAIAKARV